MNNQVKGLRLMLIAVKNINKTSDNFREYLNSGSKYFWDQAIKGGSFCISFALIKDEILLPKENIPLIDKCLKLFNIMTEYWMFSPENKEGQEKVLEILGNLKKESINIIKNNINLTQLDYFEGNFKSEYPESYSLLQTLKEHP